MNPCGRNPCYRDSAGFCAKCDQQNKVVFLAHRNEEYKTTSTEILACGNCGNKTWLAVYEAKGDGFPRLKCTCCGTSGAHFGWVSDA